MSDQVKTALYHFSKNYMISVKVAKKEKLVARNLFSKPAFILLCHASHLTYSQ